MHRRALLASLAGGLAGCSGLPDRPTPTPTATGTRGTPLAERGSPSNICRRDPVDLGIYAIDEPAVADDWADAEIPPDYSSTGGLADDHVVVGLARDGHARAYPLSVLWTHEVVNDVVPSGDGAPVLVTYCPLCRSGMVARREVDGAPATFGVSGQLWRAPGLYARAAEAGNRTFAVERNETDPGDVRNAGNLVMFDVDTGSYWSQILARAICGPQRGTELAVLPVETATWGDWRRVHPDTDVLLPPPQSGVLELPY